MSYVLFQLQKLIYLIPNPAQSWFMHHAVRTMFRKTKNRMHGMRYAPVKMRSRDGVETLLLLPNVTRGGQRPTPPNSSHEAEVLDSRSQHFAANKGD